MIHEFLHPLDWDTKQLGIKTGKIMGGYPSNLPEILDSAKSQGFRLMYWMLDKPAQENQTSAVIQTARRYGGELLDNKITYLVNLIDLKNLINIPINKNNKNMFDKAIIEHYSEARASPALIELAYESGKYSRFRVDKNLTQRQFKQLYRTWIKNSVNKTIAQDILVIKSKLSESENHSNLLGMITLGEKNHCGDIGLLAVAENARGQNIGTRLVKAAQQYFIQKGYAHSQVVTQQANRPACRLYEQCGYAVEKIELVFHFWL